LRIIDAALGRIALERKVVLRLMTISGVDPTVALPPVAAIGDFRRFGRPEQLVSYLGLNPWVKQSGCLAATHGKTPSRVAGTPEACSSRRRSPRRGQGRDGRSLNASALAAGCRSGSLRPLASWCVCAGR